MSSPSTSASSPAELASAVGRALTKVEAIRVAWVFGSRVKGTARADSDLDVAVVYDSVLDARAREEARRDVIDALTEVLGRVGEAADVVDLERCDSAVAFRAVSDGLLSVARSEAARVSSVVHAVRRFHDDAPKRALFRAAARRIGTASHG